jgi:hypothetical protein
MMLIREHGRVRLISRGGHDWARRFPLIVTAALKLRQEHFVLDGETVVLGPHGVSDFAALHSGRHNERAQLYAFDMLAGDGEDQRQLPLSLGNVHLLLFAEASAHTLCGRRVIAYYPERCAGLTGSNAPIKCTTVPTRVTCPKCASALNRPADIQITSESDCFGRG